MAIVRNLVNLHGGTVGVESAGHGQGTMFTVRLPLREAEPRRAEASAVPDPKPSRRDDPRPPQPMSLAGVRILVVDDDDDARELIGVMLATYGAQVDAVASAREAVARVERDPPDVLVSDIGLPSEDGYSLIRRVRELPGGDRVPALALTAYAGAADHRRCLDAGFEHHVSKPVEPAELASAILAIVSEARAGATANHSRGGSDAGPPLSLVVSNG